MPAIIAARPPVSATASSALQPGNGPGFVKPAIFSRRSHIDDGDITAFGENLEGSLIRLTGRRNTVNGLDAALLDNLVQIDLDSSGARLARQGERRDQEQGQKPLSHQEKSPHSMYSS